MIFTLLLELNTKDDSHELLDKVQLSEVVIHYITIYHTHWRYLTSISLYHSTLMVALK